MKKIIKFHFMPIEADEVAGDILAEMEMPDNANECAEYIKEIEDAVSSYIEAVGAWSFEELALDVVKSFDVNARIIEPITILV